MDILQCVLVLSLVSRVKPGYIIERADGGIAWEFANENCTLAAPPIEYSTNNTIKLNLNTYGVGLSQGETFWLGYVKVYRMFQYVGCIKSNKLKSKDVVKKGVQLDPGQCHSACNLDIYFGIGKSDSAVHCHCFGIDVSMADYDLNPNCTTTCQFPNNTACGGTGKDGYYYISLYKHVTTPNVKEEQSPTKLCCSYVPTGTAHFEWAKCETVYSVICEKDGKINKRTNQSFATWIRASTQCFENQEFPLTFKHNNTYIQTAVGNMGSPLWTGILRSTVILTHHDFTNNTRLLGYMEYTGVSFRIYFTRNNSDIKSGYICYTDEPDETKSNSVGVYIGVPMAVVVTIAIAVVTFIMLRKRKYKAMRQNGNKEIKGHSNTAYNDAIDVHSSPHLSKHTVTLDESSAYDLIESIPGNRDEDDDAYNTTFTSGKCIVLKETDNVYNRLETETEDTYNHVKMNTSKLTTSSNKTGDNTHSPNHVIEAEADYSHINVSSNNKSDTDNVYSKANFVKTGSAENHGDELDDTDTPYNMAGQNVNRVVQSSANENTYSHLKSQLK